AAGERLDVMIGDLEQGPVEIDEVAGDMKADDLAGAVLVEFLPEGEAFEDQRAFVARGAFADDVRAGFEHFAAEAERQERLTVGLVERSSARQFVDHSGEDRMIEQGTKLPLEECAGAL